MATGNQERATEYVILRQRELTDPEGGEPVQAWVEDGEREGNVRSKLVLEHAGEREGLWRLVPTRNWGPPIRTVMETNPKLRAEVLDDDARVPTEPEF